MTERYQPKHASPEANVSADGTQNQPRHEAEEAAKTPEQVNREVFSAVAQISKRASGLKNTDTFGRPLSSDNPVTINEYGGQSNDSNYNSTTEIGFTKEDGSRIRLSLRGVYPPSGGDQSSLRSELHYVVEKDQENGASTNSHLDLKFRNKGSRAESFTTLMDSQIDEFGPASVSPTETIPEGEHINAVAAVIDAANVALDTQEAFNAQHPELKASISEF